VAIAAYRSENRTVAQSAKDRFESLTKKAEVLAEAHILTAGVAGAGALFGNTARNHDLSIVGQTRPDSEAMEKLIVEGALFGSGRPVLVVPYIQRTGLKLDRVMVCWDGSLNVARAIADAMPLLKRAEAIDVVTIQPQERRSELPGASIARHLARHALKVDVKQIVVGTDINVPNMILSCACDSSTDLIVMGGYGHSRLREFVLGGVTRGILENMTVPARLWRIDRKDCLCWIRLRDHACTRKVFAISIQHLQQKMLRFEKGKLAFTRYQRLKSADTKQHPKLMLSTTYIRGWRKFENSVKDRTEGHPCDKAPLVRAD
jgi:nucleotide-binding universal stress UspA family protein